MRDYYLLIAVIIILAFGALKGYRKGFLQLAVWFAGLIAVLFIVTKLSPYVSSFLIDNTSVYDKIRGKIITAYEESNTKTVADETALSDENENDAIDSLGFPALISNYLKSNSSGEIYDKLALSLFEEYISGYLATLSIKAGTFVGLFVLLGLIEFVIIIAIKILEKIPVLRTFNKLLGMATGITLSLVFIWIFFLGVMMFFGHSFGTWVFSQVKASRFLTLLFNNNILFELIK